MTRYGGHHPECVDQVQDRASLEITSLELVSERREALFGQLNQYFTEGHDSICSLGDMAE